jgi:hypothetical protein
MRHARVAQQRAPPPTLEGNPKQDVRQLQVAGELVNARSSGRNERVQAVALLLGAAALLPQLQVPAGRYTCSKDTRSATTL